MSNELVILSAKNNKVVVFNKKNNQTTEYSKNFLRKRFEMGLFDIENPELLYHIPVSFA